MNVIRFQRTSVVSSGILAVEIARKKTNIKQTERRNVHRVACASPSIPSVSMSLGEQIGRFFSGKFCILLIGQISHFRCLVGVHARFLSPRHCHSSMPREKRHAHFNQLRIYLFFEWTQGASETESNNVDYSNDNNARSIITKIIIFHPVVDSVSHVLDSFCTIILCRCSCRSFTDSSLSYVYVQNANRAEKNVREYRLNIHSLGLRRIPRTPGAQKRWPNNVWSSAASVNVYRVTTTTITSAKPSE